MLTYFIKNRYIFLKPKNERIVGLFYISAYLFNVWLLKTAVSLFFCIQYIAICCFG